MADMALTRRLLDTQHVSWFRNKRNTEQATKEISMNFTSGPNRTFMSNPEKL